MKTIQLKISDKVYDRVLWLLSKFSKDEVEIVRQDNMFLSTQSCLEKELDELKKGEAILLSQAEFEERLSDFTYA